MIVHPTQITVLLLVNRAAQKKREIDTNLTFNSARVVCAGFVLAGKGLLGWAAAAGQIVSSAWR